MRERELGVEEAVMQRMPKRGGERRFVYMSTSAGDEEILGLDLACSAVLIPDVHKVYDPRCPDVSPGSGHQIASLEYLRDPHATLART